MSQGSPERGGYLLDTDTLIFMMRPGHDALRRRIATEAMNIYVSTISVMELSYGAAKSSEPERNLVAITEALATLLVLDFETPTADQAGRIRAKLARRGTPIGAYDVLIAGHAKSLGLTLVTHNGREFARVPGLQLVDWMR